MGYKEKTVGGGSATGLATDFIDFLKPLITTGSFGSSTSGQQFGAANPSGSAMNIFGLLNSLISNPQADQSVQQLISKDVERGRNDLRARFGSQGGMAFGTPAAFAESLYQAEQAPRTAIAMDQMAQARLGALMPFFQAITNLSGMGIPQAQTVMEPAPWMQGINLALDIANTAANFIPGDKTDKTDTRVPKDTRTPSKAGDWNVPPDGKYGLAFQPFDWEKAYI